MGAEIITKKEKKTNSNAGDRKEAIRAPGGGSYVSTGVLAGSEPRGRTGPRAGPGEME